MLAESEDDEEIIARVAALDIGKAELVCCVRVPGAGGAKRRLQEVSTHSTMTPTPGVLVQRPNPRPPKPAPTGRNWVGALAYRAGSATVQRPGTS